MELRLPLDAAYYIISSTPDDTLNEASALARDNNTGLQPSVYFYKSATTSASSRYTISSAPSYNSNGASAPTRDNNIDLQSGGYYNTVIISTPSTYKSTSISTSSSYTISSVPSYNSDGDSTPARDDNVGL